jgi:hypothetical protein
MYQSGSYLKSVAKDKKEIFEAKREDNYLTLFFCWNKSTPYSGCQIRYFGDSVEVKAINQTSRK